MPFYIASLYLRSFSLLPQKSHTYEAGYVFHTSNCICIQIMHCGKII